MLITAGIASAAIPDGDGVIHACYTNRTGTLRVIDAEASAQCTSKETAVEWSVTGPQGPPGADGTITATYQRSETGPSGATTVTVSCDAGDILTGGGADTDGTLTESRPYTSGFGSDVPIGWRAVRTGGISVTAFVVCVDAAP